MFDEDQGWEHVEPLGWVLLPTRCKVHRRPVTCPCDFRIGDDADRLVREHNQAENDEYDRLETEDPDMASVLPW